MIKSAVILAGGKSSRYGHPKGLVIVDGRPLIEKLIDIIKSAGISEIYISTDNPELYGSCGLNCVSDIFKDCGPLGGIHAALTQIVDDEILILSCDLPRISSIEIKAIIKRALEDKSPIVFAATPSRQHPLCAVIRKNIVDEIARSLENCELSVLDFYERIKSVEVLFSDEEPFLNLNSPEDLSPRDKEFDETLSEDYRITRFVSGSGATEMDDPVIRETLVQIWLNDDEIVEVQTLAKEVEELALGLLYSECIINDPSAVESIEFNEKLLVCTVKTSEPISLSSGGLVRNIAPGCGQVVFSIAPKFKTHFTPVETKITVPVQNVVKLMRELMRSSGLFQTTGGVHTAGLSDSEALLHVSDDIGRHNCIDKIIGHMLLNPSLREKGIMILTSGRISIDVVTKAVRGQIPLVVSRSAPTMGAVKFADQYGITLIGFTRGSRLNIYTHKERIEL